MTSHVGRVIAQPAEPFYDPKWGGWEDPLAREQRRLAAIVAADVVGYSRLMGRDESGTLAALKALRREVVDPRIAAHGGRIVKTTGDGLLLEFPSVVDAVRCVVEAQTAVGVRMADVPEDSRIAFRIGVNLGDIIIDGDDIFGDGVNIAARLEGIAEPGGVCLSDDAYRQVRGKIDLIFDDLGPQTLKNIALPMNAWRLRMDAGPGLSSSAKSSLSLPDKPSIAVVPFANMSGDPEQEYFTDGMTEDIITELSRFRDLFVIARNSAFTYKGKAIDVRQVAAELGVRYVLEGSIRRAGNRVRVTGQLIDAVSGAHLWAERYDRELSDIFAVQEEITRSIVVNIAPAIEDSSLANVRRVSPANLNAYEIAVRAWSESNTAYLSGDAAMRDKALASAQRALELDPDCVRAYLTLAFVHWQSEFYSGRDSTLETCSQGLEAARRAIELDRLEHRAYAARGLLYLRLARHDDALADLRQACELNPNEALALNSLAFGEVMNGDGPAAKDHLLQVLRLSPRDPSRYNACAILGNACFLTGEYAEGLRWVAESKREHPNFPPAILIGIRLHVGLGQIDQARSEADLLRRLWPHAEERAITGATLFRRPEDRERSMRFSRIAFGSSSEATPKTNAPAEAAAPTLALPDIPSIAVLPFQNMSGDPEQEYFADGVVEDIITALSRFKSLFVIARNSSFAYKGKSPDIRQVGRGLGVRYVLEGSVRKAGHRLRITAQLIDATSGAHTWADRFEGALEDVFAFQDEVTVKVVAAIAPHVERVEIARAGRRPSGNTNAYDCYLRGLSCLTPISAKRTMEAMRLFAEASALDPDYAAAYAMTMWCHASRVAYGMVEDVEQERSEVTRLLRLVSRLGHEDGLALSQAAWAVAIVLRDLPSAKQLIDRAVEMNPNLATAWSSSGWINLWLGHPEVALEHLGRAQRLDPGQLGANPMWSATAHALFFLGRYEESLTVVEQMLRYSPDHHAALRVGAASAALAGHRDKAHRLAAHLQSIDPAFAVSRVGEYTGPYQKPDFVEKYTQGMRLAELPE